jgi:hypothetical protein
MALSNSEKAQVLDALENVDEATKFLILASLDAFVEWLSNILYAIYVKIKAGLAQLWSWLRSQF